MQKFKLFYKQNEKLAVNLTQDRYVAALSCKLYCSIFHKKECFDTGYFQCI